MAVSEDSLIDTLFDGRYRIVRKLGAGGMADVYLAEDQELGRRIAIKILNDRHANDDQFIERFRREAKNAAALNHPNIVSIYDRGEAEDTYYIAMEYLDGRSLKELIVGHGPAPPKVAVEYARQILSALRFAHRHGIVHRDIKPHNVLVDREGRVKVTDFGIARAGTSQMTEAGSIVGTAQYLSPEQARGGDVDPRSDLYSLGVVLYELLTGETPFEGDTPVEIAMKHLSKAPEPPSSLRPGLPRELDMVVMRALAKDPEDRYQSADEMEADLERVVRGAPVSAVTAESATQVMKVPAYVGPASATMIAPPRRSGPPLVAEEEYEELEEDRRPRRPIWPWLVALVFVLAAAAAGWYVYHQLAGPSHVKESVGFYVRLHKNAAEAKITADHLNPHAVPEPSQTVASGLVIRQKPVGGKSVPKGSTVTIWYSTGKPKVQVPTGLVGQQEQQVVQALKNVGLNPKIVPVPGPNKGQVTATDPKSGATVVKGSDVRVNVMSGPAPVNVPDVLNDQLPDAIAALKSAGFKYTINYVKSNQPANQVVSQSPNANTQAPKGSTVTLNVSNAPQTTTVPDETGKSQDVATSDLQNLGFKVNAQPTPTNDATQDGLVVSESPQPGAQAQTGSTVTIYVGQYNGPPTTTTTTTTG
ncbi:MAG TPA: Stk1 family PASTA domain-containing Ser/Thr kinase [Gaiellaceae bacterium]|jgi:serine/threonine-protein kinase|nr:Stk1 family PASTA domain-containing Ser/Thr kinase [Gaiellaceae bacterium]